MSVPGSRGRGAMRVAAVVVAALALIGWSLVWRMAARETDKVLTSWIAEEKLSGRLWSCPGRAIGGYPWRIRVNCPHLAFEGPIFDRSFSGSIAGFEASAALFQPDHVRVEIAAPFKARTEQGDRFALDWTALALVVEGGSAGRGRLGLEGERLSLNGSTSESAPIEASAALVRASFQPTPNAVAAYDFAVTIEDARVPPLHELPLLDVPVTATFAGTISEVDLAAGGDFGAQIERWRTNGGRIDFSRAKIVGGEASVAATGTLDLDTERRPRGEFDVRLKGAEKALGRFGVDPGLLALGARFSGLLAGDPDSGIRLPLRIVEGRVSIGPFRTSLSLSPLY